MRARRGVLVLAVLAATAPAAYADHATITVFNGEDNRLNAYDAATLAKQTVIPSAADAPGIGRDINAQICFDQHRPGHFIAGEDTGQTAEGGQGWGYFAFTGDRVGTFTWAQVGKLEPTYVTTGSNPENYGCGFLSDGRLVTTDVGDQLPFQPATGQLIVWFPPFDRTDVPYCKIDIEIPTAGQILVDDQDRVYVGAQRGDPTDPTRPAGIWRYQGDWPTGPDAAGGCGRTDPTGAPLVDEGRISREVFIPASPLLATPSAVVPSPAGGFYASSVFDGRITEYDADGLPVRPILAPAPGEAPPYATGTPLGLGIDSHGTLYYADLGVVVEPGLPPDIGPGDHTGSVRRIRFEDGDPLPPEIIDDGLNFPDGIGILEVAAQPPPQAAPPTAPPAPAPPPAPLPTTGGGAVVAALLLLVGAGWWRRR